MAELIMLPIQRDRHKIAFTLENVLTSTECSDLVDSAEQDSWFWDEMWTWKQVPHRMR